jgi:hypothetical protein
MADDKVKLFMAPQFKYGPVVLIFALFVLGWTSFCLGQTSQPTPNPGQGPEDPRDHATTSTDEQPSVPRAPASLSGTVADQSGAVIAGARVRLTRTGNPPITDNQSLSQEIVSDSNGQFFFSSVAPGPFQLTITSAGFEMQTSSGVLLPGEIRVVPQIALAVATNITDVQVGVSQAEVAEEQMKVEEQQRVLGVLPNFYVSYIPDAAPLTPKQKFRLAGKTMIDPFTFVIVGGAAGVEQAQNHFKGYGQGAQGYAKRFGAGYADTAAGTFIGAAILPAILKQDPRYFYKGTGSMFSRFFYATANSVICKGDNGHWQANYSNVLGNLAAGGISNLYYPAQDRNGAGLTLANGAIGLASTAVANVFQEFFIRKLTPKAPKETPAAPKTSTGF